MAKKLCESDTLPAEIVKEGLKVISPVITKLNNISLNEDVFATKWKIPIMQPLLNNANLVLKGSKPQTSERFKLPF